MRMRVAYSLVLLALLVAAMAVPFVPGGQQVVPQPLPRPAGCCFNDSVAEHGQVVLAFPSKCIQLVCSDGDIQPHFLGKPGALNCCEFDGLLYEDGAELSAHCLSIKCFRGHWTPSSAIDDCCRHCCLHDDPHIYTFDDYQYDWHGSCNYSLAQTDRSHRPEAGVFSHFQSCNGLASCLRHTTFRDSPNTIISLDNGDVFTLLVNGDTYVVSEAGAEAVRTSTGAHPVLAWRNGYCTMLLGSSRILLQHCRHRLDVWAHPSHADNLDGLCGHYNFFQDDDFTDRDGQEHPLHYWPSAFPTSWLTSDQSDSACYDSCPGCKGEMEDPCHADEGQRAGYRDQCQGYFQSVLHDKKLHNHIRTCEFDLCMLYQNGGSDGQAREWLSFLLVNVKISKTLLDFTLPGTQIDVPKDLLDVKLYSCGCVEGLQPEVATLEEQLPRLLETLKELHHAIKKFGVLETLTIVRPRGLVGNFKEIMGKAKTILGRLKNIWNEGRSNVPTDRLCPFHSIKTARHDLVEVLTRVQKILLSLREDDPLVQEVRLNIEETIDTVGSAVTVVTKIKITLDSNPCSHQ